MPLYYWIYQTRCEKKIKCSASLAFYLFSSTRLINSIKHEHSCKILYQHNNHIKMRLFKVFPALADISCLIHEKRLYAILWCHSDVDTARKKLETSFSLNGIYFFRNHFYPKMYRGAQISTQAAFITTYGIVRKTLNTKQSNEIKRQIKWSNQTALR